MRNLENLYRQIIMDHYKNPRNKGLKDDPSYKSEHIKNPSCGDDITIQTKVEDGIVKDIRHEGSGCSICCSSASVLSELLKGKTVEDAEKIAENYLLMLMDKPFDESIDMEDAIAYQGVKQFPARIKCASIAWKAFQNTLK
ncbi:MAG: Fe-S cluster assembly sulfur transfer protein SufU [Bacillota bacterium]